jgi:hypothetical protein
MEMSRTRTSILIIDGLSLLGLIVFSVLSAVHPHTRGYIFGQIGCIMVVLGSVLVLHELE